MLYQNGTQLVVCLVLCDLSNKVELNPLSLPLVKKHRQGITTQAWSTPKKSMPLSTLAMLTYHPVQTQLGRCKNASINLARIRELTKLRKVKLDFFTKLVAQRKRAGQSLAGTILLLQVRSRNWERVMVTPPFTPLHEKAECTCAAPDTAIKKKIQSHVAHVLCQQDPHRHRLKEQLLHALSSKGCLQSQK